jgi:hypothetical protein
MEWRSCRKALRQDPVSGKPQKRLAKNLRVSENGFLSRSQRFALAQKAL